MSFNIYEADNDVQPIEAAQTILNNYISRSGVIINHVPGSNRACYIPILDTIALPAVGQFDTIEEYYSTAFHEAAHSTGHISRLNRITKTAAFGDAAYSREELTAEISAAMLMNIAGVELSSTFTNSAAYIQGWSKRLREDNKTIISASAAAQKATDYILNH